VTMIGTVLVLASWLTLATIVVGSGLLSARVVGAASSLRIWLSTSIWWGLGLLTLITLGLSLLLPLRSAATAGILVGFAAVLSAPGWWLAISQFRRRKSRLRPSGWALLLIVAVSAAIVYLAFKATGPATNYDTGLYHYGMIRYAGDYGTVPGLANLFLPFGYANAQFPLAAVLTNGPWGIEGWRLLNGLVFVLVAVELFLRVSARRLSWGTYVLVIGVGAVSLPVIGMADSLVTSPTSDTSVLLLAIVSAAYFCDLLEKRGHLAPRLSVVIVTTALAVALRPTMLIFAAGMALAIIVVLATRHQFGHLNIRFWTMSGLWLGALGTIQIVRDYVLSGWLIYPLSIFGWDVPWLARDPVNLREATLAAARNPLDPDGYQVAHSWNWLVPWLQRLPSQWETWFLLVAFVISALSFVWTQLHGRNLLSIRLLAVALFPSLAAIIAWFVASPPSFRFAWGPIFLVPIIVIAWSWLNLPRRTHMQAFTMVAVSLALLGVTTYSMLFRNQLAERNTTSFVTIGPLSIGYSIAPLPNVPTAERTMELGLVVQEPIVGDQCWSNYPLCTIFMGDKIGLLGEDIAEGFVTLP